MRIMWRRDKPGRCLCQRHFPTGVQGGTIAGGGAASTCSPPGAAPNTVFANSAPSAAALNNTVGYATRGILTIRARPP